MMNPCPCGYAFNQTVAANVHLKVSNAIKTVFSGPLLDRIDLHIDVPPCRQMNYRNGHRVKTLKRCVSGMKTYQQQIQRQQCF